MGVALVAVATPEIDVAEGRVAAGEAGDGGRREGRGGAGEGVFHLGVSGGRLLLVTRPTALIRPLDASVVFHAPFKPLPPRPWQCTQENGEHAFC